MIKAILTFFSGLFGFSEKIAENKAIKIPMKEESIRSEAHKDAVKDNIKSEEIQEDYDEQKQLDRWYAEAKLLNLSIRKRKKLNKIIKNTIKTGKKIIALTVDDVIT